MLPEYLSEDMIVEIFSRLPSKSVLRFRSLSKSLRSRIDSPDFIRLHALQSPKKVLIMHDFRVDEYGIQDFYKSHSKDHLLPSCSGINGDVGITPAVDHNCFPYATIVGSCNGILCLFSYTSKQMALWNPSVRRILKLPVCPTFRYLCEVYYFSTGLGFDPITSDYKIVMTSYFKHRIGLPHSFVYTIKTGTWCKIPSLNAPLSYVNTLGCFVRGALHWVVRHFTNQLDPDESGGREYIMTFDLSTHVFGTIELPEPIWKTNWKGSQLTVIDGSLAIISVEGDNTLIWVRREHNNTPSSWCLDFKLENHHIFEGVKQVFQLTTNGYLLFHFLRDGLHVYDPQTKALSRLVAFDVSCSKFDVVTCAESLELLDIGTPFGTPFKLNQTSFLEANRESRTSKPKILHLHKEFSTRLRKMCDFISHVTVGCYRTNFSL